MENIKSPITYKQNIILLERVSKKIIIDLYNNDLDLDVQSFFTEIDSVCIYKCLDTGYLFYYPEFLSGNELFYDSLKSQMPIKYNVPYYSEWKWEYDVCIELINPSDRVYEIGCGYGNFLKSLIEKGVSNVSGTELNMDSVRVAKGKGLEIDYITIQDKAKSIFETFDVVCTFQVLEHIYDIKSFIDASLKILRKGGKLIIAVPYNNPYLFGKDIFNTLNLPPHHMGLWNTKSFQNLEKFFPMKLQKLVIEKLPPTGYDFDRYYLINKDFNYPKGIPFKSIYDRLYYRWLKKFHSFYRGKNVIAVFTKNE
jgi:SAM-dependent methyltransferase